MDTVIGIQINHNEICESCKYPSTISLLKVNNEELNTNLCKTCFFDEALRTEPEEFQNEVRRLFKKRW